jgi:uncharacterized Zn finger protein (UPF0148 family)
VIIIKQDSEKMAALLRDGYSMLNIACPICNNPIFKNKKQVLFCPICNREVLLIDQDIVGNKKYNNLHNPKVEITNKNSNLDLTSNLELLKDIISKKLIWLMKLVTDETQLDQLEKKINMVHNL